MRNRRIEVDTEDCRERRRGGVDVNWRLLRKELRREVTLVVLSYMRQCDSMRVQWKIGSRDG